MLADKIDWQRFELAFDPEFGEKGAPATSTRLMVGLQYLKYTFDLSDEELIRRWPQNPYWQAFCGFKYMQHESPIHPTTMVKWRKRIGADSLNELINETIALALREKLVTKHDLKHVTVDSTVQEKNITYPTDSKLLYKCIVLLGKEAKARGLKVRQSYIRTGKTKALMASRYAHARQMKRMPAAVRWLKYRVLRLVPEFNRKFGHIDESLQSLLDIAGRIALQERKSKNKIYSIHEPETKCVSKGKAHKRYEFGQKVSVATTNGGNWIVSCRLATGNPYDGHTLEQTIIDIESVTGLVVEEVYLDRG